ncbi:MAG: N-acetylmuramate alpha-1-phosphate uridylyltransferase MurU [Pseudomonadota bacterium]
MILAAGRGERMRPLTQHTPKPLLKVGGKALIEYHLENLAAAGFKEVVINIAYLGEQIRDAVGDGKAWELAIEYSVEPEPLETAGAILHAMPLLGEQPFVLVNGDIWTDYPLATLTEKKLYSQLGYLVLVDNPPHHSEGDFSMANGCLQGKNQHNFTYSGISLLHPSLITQYPKKRQRFPLGEVFRASLNQQCLGAELYRGQWWDIGTTDRLYYLNEKLSKSS